MGLDRLFLWEAGQNFNQINIGGASGLSELQAYAVCAYIPMLDNQLKSWGWSVPTNTGLPELDHAACQELMTVQMMSRKKPVQGLTS